MNVASLKATIREMDADEIELEAARLRVKQNAIGLTEEETEALWEAHRIYHQLTGVHLDVQ